MNGSQGSPMSGDALSVNPIILTEKKRCTKCGEIKKHDDFGPDKRATDGKQSSCRLCCNNRRRGKTKTDKQKEQNRKWAKEHPLAVKESGKRFRIKNRDKLLKQHKEYREQNKNKMKIWVKTWTEKNLDRFKKTQRDWQVNNPEKVAAIKKRCRENHPQKIKERLAASMRNALRMSLRGSKNGRHWEYLVGYTISDLNSHLEKNFMAGMSWDNYGEWHIDHKIPISAFNFQAPEDIDFKKCWCLRNLQPLWKHDNVVKNDKLSDPFQPSFAMGY